MDDVLENSWKSLDEFSQSDRMRPNKKWERALIIQSGDSDLLPQLMNGIDTNDFLIPELPSGRVLALKLVTTWGDPFYVGLNGIEVFTDKGTRANVEKITAYGVSESNECVKLENLLSGNYKSHDSAKLWLTRFVYDQPAIIALNFDREVRLAMVRIWNYNKSRVHASRGVRLLEMTLDQELIFRGEISSAVSSRQTFGDTILFTTSLSILELIMENDVSIGEQVELERQSISDTTAVSTRRPLTGEKTNSNENNCSRVDLPTSWNGSNLTWQFSNDNDDNLAVTGKGRH